jgi:hypothetical protein
MMAGISYMIMRVVIISTYVCMKDVIELVGEK